METSPVTCRTLEEFYRIDGHTFEKQYKETLSNFRQWEQLEYADEWLLFPDNIGPQRRENDRRFVYRCMMLAHKMLRPINRKRGMDCIR